MRMRRIATAAGSLALAASITLVTANTASAEEAPAREPALTVAVAEQGPGLTPLSVDTDGVTFTVSCNGSSYGTVGWNDYADANPSDDIDNVIVIDRAGDGRSLLVDVYNQSTGRSTTAHAQYGERISAETGNLPDAGDPAVVAAAYPWDNGSADCSAAYFYFYE